MKRTAVCLGPALLLVLLVAASCGDSDDDTETTAGSGEAPAATDDTRYHGSLTVLENAEHGPQLCGVIEESYPPGCGGPDIVGWDWADVGDEESANGVTWGDYEVTGTWDGEQLTLTEPPGPPRHDDDGADSEGPGASPCPEPDGGWAVVDPATTNDQTMQATMAAAEARDDFAGSWVDQSVNPAYDHPTEAAEWEMNDPTKLVVNVRVTGDVATAEAELRETWGGALCVSEADHTMAELLAIQDELVDATDVNSLGFNADVFTNTVTASVYVDAGDQAELDDRYGEGTVTVEPLLRPVESAD
jgi:hypothetical protein